MKSIIQKMEETENGGAEKSRRIKKWWDRYTYVISPYSQIDFGPDTWLASCNQQ
jgi:hypothetical protein